MCAGSALKAPQRPRPETPAEAPVIVVVMGVSGCGKSTVGAALAAALDVPFVEGDALHPPRNVALMAAGTPLGDTDRLGWLQAVAAVLGSAMTAPPPGRGVVVSCSALKRSYRDLLRAAAPGLQCLHLSGDPSLLVRRLHARSGHYMPASLLQSQLDDLQPPTSEEAALQIDIALPPAAVVAQALHWLRPASAGL